jgi:hypothetical protein
MGAELRTPTVEQYPDPLIHPLLLLFLLVRGATSMFLTLACEVSVWRKETFMYLGFQALTLDVKMVLRGTVHKLSPHALPTCYELEVSLLCPS